MVDVVAGHSTEHRKVGILLWVGIIFFPYIFGWFVVARAGYSSTAKKITALWMVIGSVIAFAGVRSSPKTVERNTEVGSPKAALQATDMPPINDSKGMVLPAPESVRSEVSEYFPSTPKALFDFCSAATLGVSNVVAGRNQIANAAFEAFLGARPDERTLASRQSSKFAVRFLTDWFQTHAQQRSHPEYQGAYRSLMAGDTTMTLGLSLACQKAFREQFDNEFGAQSPILGSDRRYVVEGFVTKVLAKDINENALTYIGLQLSGPVKVKADGEVSAATSLIQLSMPAEMRNQLEKLEGNKVRFVGKFGYIFAGPSTMPNPVKFHPESLN